MISTTTSFTELLFIDPSIPIIYFPIPGGSVGFNRYICITEDGFVGAVPRGCLLVGVLERQYNENGSLVMNNIIKINGDFSGHPTFIGSDGQTRYVTDDFRIIELNRNPPPPSRRNERRFAVSGPPTNMTMPLGNHMYQVL